MSVRSWAVSSLDRIVLGGLGAAVGTSGFTLYVLAKPTLTNGTSFISLRASGALVASLSDGSGGVLGCETDTTSAGAQSNMSNGDWQHLAVTVHADRSITFHRKLVGGGAWTHVVSAQTQPVIAGIVDTVILGAYTTGGSGSKPGEIAVAAVLPELVNSDVEAIEASNTTQLLYDLGAAGLWNLNQAATSTAVLDLSGGSANQVTINGTSVVTGDDPPGWDFSVTVIPPLSCSVRLSGGAANADPAVSIGGAVSSESADATLFDDVSNAERTSGMVDYRLIYVHNDDDADGSALAYVATQLESGREIAVGVPTQLAGATVTLIADDETAPSGVTFSAPTTSAAGVSLGTIPAGSFRGLWLRRTVNSNTPQDPTNFATVKLEVSRVE